MLPALGLKISIHIPLEIGVFLAVDFQHCVQILCFVERWNVQFGQPANCVHFLLELQNSRPKIKGESF